MIKRNAAKLGVWGFSFFAKAGHKIKSMGQKEAPIVMKVVANEPIQHGRLGAARL